MMLVITLLWTGLPNFAGSSVRANETLTLGDLPVGSLVKETEGYYGNWIILSQGHYGAGNTLLLLDGTAAIMKEAYGTWQDSPIRSFLRSTFYEQLSQRFRDQIAEVTTYQNDEATVNETLFLLSLFELYPTDVDYPAKDILPAGGNHGTLIEGALDYLSNCVDDNKCWLRSTTANSLGRKFLVSVYVSPLNIDYRVKPVVNLIDTTPVFGPYTSEGKTYYTLFEPQIDAQLEAVKAAIDSLPDSSQVTLSHKAAIVDARSAFNALSAEQQALIDNLARLTDAEQAITALEDAVNSVKAAIGDLPAASQVTLANKTAIASARSAYNTLSAEQQALVDNLTRLTDAEQAITALEDASASVKATIGALPSANQVTLANKTAIAAARSAYNTLSAEQQAIVDNLTRLTDAEQAITALEDAVNSVKAAIGDLPAASQVTLAHKTTIASARSAYNALSAEQQAIVDNLTRLTDAEQAITALEDAANSVKAAIGDLPAASQVTLAHKTTIASARSAYNALSAEQQALVNNLTRLTDAEQAITALEDAVNSVKAAIGDLPAASQVTLAHKTTIASARSAYNALSAEQQALVDNLTRLTDAEQAITALEDAIASVISAIGDLPAASQVTLANKTAIAAARNAYNALSAEQQALVDNLARLTNTEQTITALEDAITSVKAAIGSLPDASQVTLANKTAIATVRSAYNALSAEQQALVDNLTRLTDAEQAIIALEDAIASVKAAIGDLPAANQVTLAHKTAIATARSAYNALSAEQQALVDNLTRLTDAEQAITALEDAIASVKAAIGSLPDASQVTLANKTAITAARSAYNALSAEQQALVDNLTRLTEAEQAVRLLEFTPSTRPIMSPAISDFDMWLNGKKLKLVYWSNPNGQNQSSAKSMVLFKEQELFKYIDNAENGTLLQLPILTGRDQAIVGASLPLVSFLSKKETTLAINTESYSYTIPMQHLTLDKLLKAFGPSVKAEDILLKFIIDDADEKRIAGLQKEAAAGRLTALAKPVKFSIVAVSGDVTIETQDFLGYVQRSISLPEGTPASEIVTGVVIEADGSLRHVPTKVIESNGIYRAVISSMTNSVYAIVSFHADMTDIERHWARPYISEMAARSVVQGDENGRFLPDNVVTRAEFAAMLTRALGLPAENGENPFSDVDAASWYSPSVRSAHKYGLISGFGDGTFQPGSTITRQQAAVMMASALKLAGAPPASNSQAVESSSPFMDNQQISPWAKHSIESAAQAGIVSGRANGQFDPHLEITRAETAVMLHRLLTYLKLI
jgi:cell division protein FtsB